MNTGLIVLSILAAVALFHFSYVDFRFRYRDGIQWFWRLSPAPPLMWIGRLTVIAAVLVTLAGPFVGIGRPFVLTVGVIMFVHLLSLILLEVLEPR